MVEEYQDYTLEDGKRFIVGFPISSKGEVLLVRKLNPYWQKRLLNGVGGKMKDGETPEQAIHREWQEETGDTFHLPDIWKLFFTLDHGKNKVYFFTADMKDFSHVTQKYTDDDELIEVHKAYNLPRDQVVPNLNWLIPLIYYDGSLDPQGTMTYKEQRFK